MNTNITFPKIFFLIFILSCIFELSSETIHLTIKLAGIGVVKGIIEDKDNVLTVNARSTALASLAAKTDNEYSIEYEENYLPLKYRKIIKQNDYSENRLIEYDRLRRKAVRTSYLDSTKTCEYEIVETSRDFFSALYFLKSQIDNKSGEFYLDANKSIWKAEYERVGTEQLKSIFGKIKTIKLKVDFKKISKGNKERSDMLTNNLVTEDKSLFLWYTDDERRIPLKVKFPMSPFSITWKIDKYKD